jgi:hypothetical protein
VEHHFRCRHGRAVKSRVRSRARCSIAAGLDRGSLRLVMLRVVKTRPTFWCSRATVDCNCRLTHVAAVDVWDPSLRSHGGMSVPRPSGFLIVAFLLQVTGSQDAERKHIVEEINQVRNCVFPNQENNRAPQSLGEACANVKKLSGNLERFIEVVSSFSRFSIGKLTN